MEITQLSAVELADAIREKRLSAREALDACLKRVDELNPALNAIVDLQAERAVSAAAAIDVKVARARPLGRLAGVPLTIKSSIDVAALRCECGSKFLEGRRARRNGKTTGE